MNEKLVFTHIPKTAGVSVRAVVGARYPEARILHVDNPAEFFARDLRGILDRYDFVHGHFSAETALRSFEGDYDLMVFLRDPVKRVISYYYFLRMFDENTYKGTDVEKTRISLARNTSLRDFVALTDKAVNAALSNRQLSFISEQKKGKPLQERLREAKELLGSKYSYVGITECMDRSLQLLAYRFRLCNPYVSPVLNASVRHYDEDYAGAVEIIKERNAVDLELYEFARTRFESDYYAMVDALLTRNYEANVVGSAAPVRSVNLTMESPVMGRGWYEREHKRGVVWRFSGPGNVSTIYIPKLDLQQATIRFYINCFVARDVMDSLQLVVNGRRVAYRKGSVGELGQAYVADLENDVIAAEPFLRIDFVVDETRVPAGKLGAQAPGINGMLAGLARRVLPNTSDGPGADSRRLGIGLTGVQIDPREAG